jgi:hypothetical protein
MLVRPGLVVAFAAALAFQPATAHADTVTHVDAVGDVARSPIGYNTYAPAPAQAEGDIRSIRVTHARRAIWLRLRLRELSTTTNGNFHHIGITSDRRFRSIEIDAFPGHWEGRAVTSTRRGRIVACAVTHLIDYDRNVLTVRVPRGCLGKPSWVRVGTRTAVAGATYAYVDDARVIGYRSSLVYGRRVYR